MKWHSLSIDEALELLETTGKGLSSFEARSREEKFGFNVLYEKKKKSVFFVFLSQFTDFMILILLGAALISGIVGEIADSIVILIIVLLNAIIGFVQEFRAEKAMDALKRISAQNSMILRDGEFQMIPAREIVPGDIVRVEAGNLIPADLRLIETFSLKVDESSLTGESVPVEKDIRIHQGSSGENLFLGDLHNLAFRGTVATYGRGIGVVVETGMNTQIGSIARMLQEKEAPSPLQARLSDFGKKISFVVIGICLVLLLAGLGRGESFIPMFMTAISLAVAAIPEALPAVLTITLALGASRMVRLNALVRKLSAVETLGSVTYICSDKTGTITQNKMSVRETYLPGNKESTEKRLFLLGMALNHDAEILPDGSWRGDPTETALAEYAYNHDGFVEGDYPRLAEVPFDSNRKKMATVNLVDGKIYVFVKGAVESVVPSCKNISVEEIESHSLEMSRKGLRVLAYGYKIINEIPIQPSSENLENDLTFLGIAGLIDPPRPEAIHAVEECARAGIIPVMITGDHPETARAIATEVGILKHPDDKLLSGQELSNLAEEEFLEIIGKIKVYARVSPEQKLQIVKALQGKKEFVAMTGDGVNDAPALKMANIGIAMGITGTDVSKEAAHMILLDDNFATIVKAVKEGRKIFDNIKKFIYFVMSGNSGEIWTIFLAPFLGMPIPLAPIHILWVNLVTDGLPGLALSIEREESDIMTRPPRRTDSGIFSGGMGYSILYTGILIGGACLGIQAFAILNEIQGSQTMVFTVLCISQTFIAISVRSESVSAFRFGLSGNRFLAGTIILNLALQFSILYIPFFREIFHLTELSGFETGICLIFSLVPFLGLELGKFIKRK